VINAASSDHRGAVETLIAALTGSGKALIHSSGSSIVAGLAMGERPRRSSRCRKGPHASRLTGWCYRPPASAPSCSAIR
jgi:hypothetical protein